MKLYFLVWTVSYGLQIDQQSDFFVVYVDSEYEKLMMLLILSFCNNITKILLCFFMFDNFQVDKIVDQLYQYILAYDILGLRDYWDYLNDRFFKRLDYQHYSNVKKLEMCLLRLYIVHALQNSKNDKVVEFFEKYTAELQKQTEWREWFGMLFSWCLNNFF